jgi:hypothetical protein
MTRIDGGKAVVGRWAFLIGVVLSVLFGIISGWSWLPILLIILGLIVGFLNIRNSEINVFLTAGTVLVLMGYFGGQTLASISYLQAIFNNLLTLFVPATVIVAVKSVFALARE